MCVYARMYVCRCICMHACMLVCTYVRTYVCMYVRMNECSACMYVCTYVCMYVCIYDCMYVCMYVCMCICMSQLDPSQIQVGLQPWLRKFGLDGTRIRHKFGFNPDTPICDESRLDPIRIGWFGGWSPEILLPIFLKVTWSGKICDESSAGSFAKSIFCKSKNKA